MKKIVMSALTLAIAACMSATPVISASASDDDFVCGTSLAEQELREREFEDISIKAPTKYFYQYGDKLDLSGGAIYADNMLVCYMDSPENCFLPDAQVEIDTHQFVNSDFGVYPINVRVKINGKEFRQIFCVAVEEPETAVELDDVTIADEEETEDSSKALEIKDIQQQICLSKLPDKLVYNIGEDLDFTGGMFEYYIQTTFTDGTTCNGCNTGSPLTDLVGEEFSYYGSLYIDSSAFDNETEGVYPIYIKAFDRGFEKEISFDVEVKADSAINIDDVKIANDDIAYGDVNLDGRISISDSVAVLQFIANPEKYALTDEQKANADVHNTGDGVTLKDAEAIGAFAEGMIDLF